MFSKRFQIFWWFLASEIDFLGVDLKLPLIYGSAAPTHQDIDYTVLYCPDTNMLSYMRIR